MAKPPASNKRDNEKKRLAKRQEKQKKKEERKNSGTGNFEDMIAYVDENGMITSTPPENKKEEINPEDILISVPRRTEEDDNSGYRGKVEYFNSSKGFGFIKKIDGKEKYFFHISNSPENIAEGDIVSFELKKGTRGLETINIKIENNI